MTEAQSETGAVSSPEKLFRGVGKHAVVYGLGMILSRAVSFVMLPVYTRYLSPADYGVMALIEMTLDFISIIGGAQLALGVFRFYHKTEGEVARGEIVSTSLLLVGALYLLVGGVVAMAAPFLSQLIFGTGNQVLIIRVAALNLAAGSLMIVPMTLARVKDLSTLIVAANLAKLVVAVAFNVIFIVGLGMGVLGIFLGSLVANMLVGGAMLAWLLRRVELRPTLRWTRDLLRYGVPLMGMQAATFVATFSDRYFLQAVSDESVVGLYSLAYQFGFLLAFVGFTPIDMVWGPKRFEIAQQDNSDQLLAAGFLFVNVALVTTAVGITLYVSDVLRIMATPAFHPASRVVPVILVAYLFQTWASVQDIGILVKERTQYLTLANLISAAVAVIGYAVLIPLYLEWGAAAATVLSFAVRYLLTYYYSQRSWPVRYRWKPVFVLLLWATCVCAVGLTLPALSVVASVAAHTGLGVVYLLGLCLLPILSPGERAGAWRMIRMISSSIRGHRSSTA